MTTASAANAGTMVIDAAGDVGDGHRTGRMALHPRGSVDRTGRSVVSPP